ncbi:MAG: DUF554 family protein, partial [Firmicutes bacterium]|nr:DUF554 family protein [Bacillota bacterium]
MLGSLINAAAVLAGGGVGLLLRGRIPEKISKAVLQAV